MGRRSRFGGFFLIRSSGHDGYTEGREAEGMLMTRIVWKLLAGLVVFAGLLAGCSSAGSAVFDRGFDFGAPEEALAQSEPRGVPGGGSAVDGIGEDQDFADWAVPARDGEPATPTTRLRILAAEISLVVPAIETAKQEIIDLALDAGGYVEASGADYVNLRVPAEVFEPTLDRIETLGEVQDRRISAADVTDQFTDLERRLEIARRSRDRFEDLLEESDDPDERVEILRELTRLTEEIDRLEAQMRSLQSRIAFSRIDVLLVPRGQMVSLDRGRIPFPWMARLSPVSVTLQAASRGLGIPDQPRLAVFENNRRFRAESPEGVRVRIGATPNDPAGDTAFWARALDVHLAPLYDVAEAFQAGDFAGFLFGAAEGSSYLVAVRVRGDDILVAEAYFPSAADRREYGSLVAEIIEEVDP